MALQPSSTVNLRVNSSMICFYQEAKKLITDRIEGEIAKANESIANSKSETSKQETEELKNAYINKLMHILESDIKFIRPQPTREVIQRMPPTEPVKVRGTCLTLKNIPNATNYKEFCSVISKKLNFKSDFSDAPFNVLPRNARIYEAIKILYRDNKINQDELDKIVEECEKNKE